MPISEDEFDPRQSNMQNSTNMDRMTKAELRRSNKPIMEKKRRARINHCLNELKSLILDAMKKDPARHSKLEKADILEMTVRHLQSVQRRQQQQQMLQQQMPADVNSLSRFRGGFGECAQEVAKCTKGLTGQDAEVARRLVAHLDNCVSGLNQITPPANPLGFPTNTNPMVQTPLTSSDAVAATNAPNSFLLPGDVNNNGSQSNQRIQMGGVQLIPSRLPTGELALVLPHSSNLPFFPQSTPASAIQIGASSTSSRQSAFTAVISSHQKVVNPLLSPADTLSSDSNTSDEDNLNKTPARRPSPQQPHISSTTTISPESLKATPLIYPSGYKEEGTKIYGFHQNQEDVPKVGNSNLSTSLWVESVQKSRKRQCEEDSFLDEERKKAKVSSTADFEKDESDVDRENVEDKADNNQQQQNSSEMWRPW